jgi:hypothetical protein
MRYAFLIVLLVSLHSLEGTGLPLLPVQQVDAEEMKFENHTLSLTGNVKIVHDFGTISCQEGTLFLPDEKKEADISFVEKIFFRGNVHIKLSDGSELLADEGDIDCSILEGIFRARPPQKVIYISYAADGKERIPVKATSRIITAKITKGPLGYTLGSIRGEGAVNIEYVRPTTTPRSEHEEELHG